jgi:anti-sigma factor RsiW
MEHLSSETLSRLVDERPAPEERAHLERCEACKAELQALRVQTSALRSLPDLRPPVGDWEVIQARMVSEGLVRRPGSFAATLAVTPGWMRAAAAVLLFLAGGVAGAAFTRTQGLALGGPADASAVSTVDEAARLVRSAEESYVDAIVRYNQLVEMEGGGDDFADPATRFAALDNLVNAGRAALRLAPADPFLNGFLVSLTAERQAQLRRISSGPDNWF